MSKTSSLNTRSRFNRFLQKAGNVLRKGTLKAMMPLMLVSNSFAAPTQDQTGPTGPTPKTPALTIKVQAVQNMLASEYGEAYAYGSDWQIDRVIDAAATPEDLQLGVQRLKGKPLAEDDVYEKLADDTAYARQMHEQGYKEVRQQILPDTLGTMQFKSPVGGSFKDIHVTGQYGKRALFEGSDHKGVDGRFKPGTPVYYPGAKLVESHVARRGGIGMVTLDVGKHDGKRYRVVFMEVDVSKYKPGHVFGNEPVTFVSPPHRYHRHERSTAPHLHTQYEKETTPNHFKPVNGTMIFEQDGLYADLKHTETGLEIGEEIVADVVADTTGEQIAHLDQDLTRQRKSNQMNKKKFCQQMKYLNVLKQKISEAEDGAYAQNRQEQKAQTEQAFALMRQNGKEFQAESENWAVAPAEAVKDNVRVVYQTTAEELMQKPPQELIPPTQQAVLPTGYWTSNQTGNTPYKYIYN